ncbi:hypothetical protein [Rhodanobacter sp. MP1X3]|uniref:hypothetical protein n=1 Tax=Rhodanobacter sp. MP1X3 TaxID=2723086 RepID=UPI0016167A7C|nr:hypothetical protein [Rhodanobacter sp. MP1X3]MBB6240646.1 hypothetical protein [Rhodanobacter sp. MP1X3]
MSQNLLNVVAIFVCAAIAHLLPETTLLGAYAILGPAHYLTEISWLHDRRYFVGRPWLLIVAAYAALVIMLVRPHTPPADGALFALLGGLIAAGIGMPFIVTVLVAVTSAVVGVAGAILGWVFVAAIAILVPTLIHVFAFTTMFMLTGATRGRRMVDWLPVMALTFAAASFVLVPTMDLGRGAFMTIAVQGFSRLFAQLSVPGHSVELRVVGFLGFAYSYHYVNWFLKTGLLGWHRVSLGRLVLLVSTWVLVMFAYTENILLGLLVSLPLSLGHVLLELPLNVLTARRLVTASFSRSRLSVP